MLLPEIWKQAPHPVETLMMVIHSIQPVAPDRLLVLCGTAMLYGDHDHVRH